METLDELQMQFEVLTNKITDQKGEIQCVTDNITKLEGERRTLLEEIKEV